MTDETSDGNIIRGLIVIAGLVGMIYYWATDPADAAGFLHWTVVFFVGASK